MSKINLKYISILALFIVTGYFLTRATLAQAGSARYVDFNFVGTENGTSTNPYNTMNEAVQLSAVGDVIYIKSGTYNITPANRTNFEVRNFTPAGSCTTQTTSNTLKITADPANSAEVLFQMSGAFAGNDVFRIYNADCIWFDGANRIKFDGTGATFSNENRSLVIVSDFSENVIFENSEVRDADVARGLSFYNHDANPANTIIRNNYVHHIYTRAIGGFGKGVLVEGNLVEYAVMKNYNNALCCSMGGWPAAIQTAYDYQDNAYSQNIDFINNTVRNSWGEGLAIGFLLGGKIKGNIVYNTFSMNIYIDNSQGLEITNNYTYSTDPAYYRSDKGTPANGIGFATEEYWGTPPTVRTQNLTIANNLIVGVSKGITYFHDENNTNSTNTYDGIKIFNNVIKNVSTAPISIDQVTMGTPPANTNEVRNNILYLGSGNANPYYGNASAWSVSNNQFVNYNDATNAPRFVGSNLNPGDAVTNFKLASISPNINSGVANSVTIDYFGTARVGNPDIGFHEYNGISNSIYYVDAVAGSDTNSGMSQASAWKTISKASSFTYGEGDQILFKSGQTFSSNTTFILNGNGSTSNKINVGIYGGTAKAKMKITDITDTSKPIVEIMGSNFIFKDIEFFNDTGTLRQTGLKVSGSNNTIENLDISNVGHAIYNLGSSNIYRNNSIHDLVMIVNDATANNDYGAVGLLLGDGSNTVSAYNNIFLNLSPTSIDYGRDGSALELFGQVQNVQFYNNKITNAEGIIEIGSSDNTDITQNIVLHHNLIIDSRRSFVFHNDPGASFGLNINTVKLENNTIVKNSADTNGFVLAFAATPASNTFYFRNNIVDVKNLSNFSLNANSVVHTYNLYQLTNVAGQIYTYDSSELQGSPLFVASNDYQLQSASPAVDSGTNLSYMGDLLGNTVPMGSGPDIGAYEKVQVAVSISLQTDGTINFGQRQLGTTVDSTVSGVNDVQTIKVNTGPTDLLIKTTDFISGGGNWVLAATAANDQAVYQYSLDGSAWTNFSTSNSNFILAANQPTNQSVNIYFRLALPTTSSSILAHTTTTTITAVSP